MRDRPKIVLTMIVKDEARVIRRCLESVKPFISGWAIADTGSRDGTQALIREILAGIPGELIERPWQDFATNRNEAIEAAEKQSPDWMLTLDADEELSPSPGFALSGLDCDTYDAQFRVAGTNAVWARKLLFRPGTRYRFVLDEVLEQGKTHGILRACEVVSHTDGARSQEGLKKKYERDCAVYREALEREPENTRYWFYLAQRAIGAGEFSEGIYAAGKRIELGGGFEEEIGYCHFLVAQAKQLRGDDWRDVARAYQVAFQAHPTRAESLYAAACLHSENGEHAVAEVYARAAQRIPRPQDILPVDESVYAWRAADLLAGALAEQGKVGEARALLEKLVALPQLPTSEHERVHANIRALREAEGPPAQGELLGPDEVTYFGQARAIRTHGLKAFCALGREYLASFTAQSLPSPVRWLWALLVAIFGRWATVLGALACVAAVPWIVAAKASLGLPLLVVAGSPLLLLLGRRRLQDAPIAAVTIVALGFAIRGESIGFASSLFALLALKEASVLALPAFALAWMLSGAGWSGFAAGTGAAISAYALSLAVLFGRMALPMLLAGARGHSTPYARDHQRGAWHRLAVDLFLVSPVTTVLGLFGPAWLSGLALAILIAFTAAPIRNVRFVLAADLLLRASAALAFGWLALPALIADVYVSRKLRNVYDPVTGALTAELGMSR